MAAKRAYERPPRTTSLPKLKSQSKMLQQTLRPTTDDAPSRASTRASSAMSTRAPSRCSSAMSSDGEEDTPRLEVVLRQAVLDQIECSLALAPSMSSHTRAPKQKPSTQPAPLTARGSKDKSDIKLQAQQPRTPRASKGTSRNMSNDAATRRRTLVENVKGSLRDQKASRSATGANSSSQLPEDNVGLASRVDTDFKDDECVSNQNKSHGTAAMLPVTDIQETTQESSSNDAREPVEEQVSARVGMGSENMISVETCDLELESNVLLSGASKGTETIDANETFRENLHTPKLLESGPEPSKLRKRLMRACTAEQDEFQLPSPDVQAARKAFLSYDLDGDGSLNASEFGKLLRDQGLNVNYKEALEASEAVSGEKGTVDFDSFKHLFARAQKEEKKEAQKRQGFSAEEADFLHAVFDKYDVTHNQKLEGFELSRFLEDIGKAPGSTEEQLSLRHQLEQVRGGVLGPLTFKHFLAFVRLLDMQDEVEQEKQREEAAKCAGLSKQEVEQLKGVFEAHAQDQETLCCSEVYELLRHGLHLHAAEGQHELRVRAIVQSHALNSDVAAGVNFLGFLGVIGDIVAEKGDLLVEDPSPMNISKFEIRSVSSVVAPITAGLKLQKSKETSQ